MRAIISFSRVLRHDSHLICCRSMSSHQYFSAVCLQRRPKVTPPLNVIEKTMHQLLLKQEVALSLFSDHEQRHFEDLRRAERLANREEADEKDIENASKQTAADFEDASNKELQSITLASNVTPDDVTNNQKSLNRRLDRHLMLVTKMQLGNSWKWFLPFAPNLETETLRQTAERALLSSLGSQEKMKITFLGNCPSAVYSYHYLEKGEGKSAKPKKKSARIFIFKALTESREFDAEQINSSTVNDFSWLDRNEAAQLFAEQKTDSYWRSIRSCLFHEQMPDERVSRIISRVRDSITRNADKRQATSA